MDELTEKSSPARQLKAVIDVAITLNADQAQFICRDSKDEIQSIAIYLEGDDAIALDRWMEQRKLK